MRFESHVEEFAGLRVRDFVAFKGIVDPIGTAYRVGLDAYDERRWDIEFSENLVGLLADLNIARLKALVIGLWNSQEDSAEIVEALVSAHRKLKQLRGLFLGDIVRAEQEISWIRQSDLSALFGAFPNLRHLQVRGAAGLSLGRIAHRELRSLVVQSGGLPATVVQQIMRADLPKLEHFELWLGDEEYGGDASPTDLEPLLAGDRFPKLKTLGVRNFRFADAFAEQIASAPVLRKLAVLDLSLGTLTDAGAQALVESSNVRRLKKLDVHHHYLSLEVTEALRALPIEVDASRRLEPEDEDGFSGRYVAVSE